MIITLSNSSSMSDAKNQFRKLFPNLTIEFYKVPHREGEGTPDEFKWTEDVLLKKAYTAFKEGHIALSIGMNVSILERLFREQFGAYIQVFRKSGNEWIETTSTDDWSLKKQNEIGGMEIDL